MARYRGKHIYTLTDADVGKITIPRDPCPTCGHYPRHEKRRSLRDSIGYVQKGDVGKMVMEIETGEHSTILCVENDQQRDERLRDEQADGETCDRRDA